MCVFERFHKFRIFELFFEWLANEERDQKQKKTKLARTNDRKWCVGLALVLVSVVRKATNNRPIKIRQRDEKKRPKQISYLMVLI